MGRLRAVRLRLARRPARALLRRTGGSRRHSRGRGALRRPGQSSPRRLIVVEETYVALRRRPVDDDPAEPDSPRRMTRQRDFGGVRARREIGDVEQSETAPGVAVAAAEPGQYAPFVTGDREGRRWLRPVRARARSAELVSRPGGRRLGSRRTIGAARPTARHPATRSREPTTGDYPARRTAPRARSRPARVVDDAAVSDARHQLAVEVEVRQRQRFDASSRPGAAASGNRRRFEAIADRWAP